MAEIRRREGICEERTVENDPALQGTSALHVLI